MTSLPKASADGSAVPGADLSAKVKESDIEGKKLLLQTEANKPRGASAATGGAPAARKENTISYAFVLSIVFEDREAAGEESGAA